MQKLMRALAPTAKKIACAIPRSESERQLSGMPHLRLTDSCGPSTVPLRHLLVNSQSETSCLETSVNGRRPIGRISVDGERTARLDMEPLGDLGLSQPSALPPIEDAIHAVVQQPVAIAMSIDHWIGRQQVGEHAAQDRRE